MNCACVLPGLRHGASVLVIRLRSLGDMVLLVPSLRALKEWRPDLELTVLAEEPFAPALEGNPDVSDVVIRGPFAATAMELRRRRFDAVFNQHGGPTSALLTFASGAPIRVGGRGKQFSFLYNVTVPDAAHYYGRKDYHTVEELLAQFHQCGLPETPPPPARVYPRQHAGIAVTRRLAGMGVAPGRPMAVIHPSGTYDNKTWPAARFAAVARRLRDETDLWPVSILGPSDAHLEAGIREHLGSVGTVIDSLSLVELIALISRARLFLGVDSGPAQIAAAAGQPVVVVFGASNHVRWRPWTKLGRVVRSEFACSPCPEKRCDRFDEPRCILSVTEDQVWKACREAIEESARVAAEAPREFL